MNRLILIFFAVTLIEIKSDNIKSKIQRYFNSETTKLFESKWKPFEDMFEHSIGYTLQEGFGRVSMNVYINRYINPLALSSGYYHTDNQVKLFFRYMGLEELPHLYGAEVTFALHSNTLSFEASISKIIVHTNYVVFRNKSEIIFSVADQNPFKDSPFRFQQVRNIGELAISITGCTLSGVVVATLSGKSVNLGHHQFKLTDCQYNLEIYSPGTGAPPVIANYLPNGETGTNLEVLLMRPLIEELMPKLQSVMFAGINTSSVFTNKLTEIRDKQEWIFEETNDYMEEVVRRMNKKSIEKNMGTINLDNFTIFWDDTFQEPHAKTVTLFKMSMMGLDTLYSSHSGGPIRLTEIEIIEQLRFSTLEVIGTILVVDIEGKVYYDNEFALEISDYAVDVTLDSNLKAKFEILGWRFIEFSCPKLDLFSIESLVIGYLLKELPKRIKLHLNSVYDGSVSKLSYPLHIDDDVYKHEDANDGKYEDATVEKLGKVNKPMLLNKKEELKQVKLNHVEIEPYVEEQGNVKLHHVEIVPHVEEDEPVKLHHVAVHYDEEHVKINDEGENGQIEDPSIVKLHHVEVDPYTEEEEPVKVHHVAAVHHDEKDEKKLGDKVPKKVARNNGLKLRKRLQMQQERTHIPKSNKQIKPIKRVSRGLNQVPTKIPKAVHMSDNEISSR